MAIVALLVIFLQLPNWGKGAYLGSKPASERGRESCFNLGQEQDSFYNVIGLADQSSKRTQNMQKQIAKALFFMRFCASSRCSHIFGSAPRRHRVGLRQRSVAHQARLRHGSFSVCLPPIPGFAPFLILPFLAFPFITFT